MPASVGAVKVDAISQEEDCSRMRPDRLEPFGLSAGMQKRDAVAQAEQGVPGGARDEPEGHEAHFWLRE